MLGIEANICGRKGQIDLKTPDMFVETAGRTFDLLLLGYHQMVLAASCKEFFSFNIPIQTAGIFRHTTDRRRKKNTEAFINAIERYPIDIIVHPNRIMEIDFLMLAEAAARLGVYLELNGKKNRISDADIQKALERTSVQFIVNSDAHSPARAGNFELPLSVIERNRIPAERIANAGGVPPVFRRKSIE